MPGSPAASGPTSEDPARKNRQNGAPPPLTKLADVPMTRDALHHTSAGRPTDGMHEVVCAAPADAPPATCSSSVTDTATSADVVSARVSAAERCRRARALASRWMSVLMQKPPTKAEMDTFRTHHLSLQTSETDPLPTAAASAHTDGIPAGRGTSKTQTTTAASTAPSSSFAEAVRRGHLAGVQGEQKPSSPPLVPVTLPPAATAGLTSAAARLPSTSSALTQSSHVDPAASDENTTLMPNDEEALGPLLRALREVALCTSSLDTLRKLASLPPGSDGSSPQKGSGHTGSSRRHHHAHHSTPRQSPPPSPAAGPSTGAITPPASTARTSPAVGPGSAPAAVVDPVVESVFTEQWNTVQSHLLKMELLVQNHVELARVLTTTLGADWRRTTPAARQQTPPKLPRATSSRDDAAQSSAAETTSRVGAPPAPVATAPIATGGTAGSGLNLNARPFQSRTFLTGLPTPPLAVATTAASSRHSLNEEVVAPVSATSDDVAGAATVSSRKATKSLRTLSESATAYYSPSPHVASFIERNSPIPAGTSSVVGSEHTSSSLRSTPIGSHGSELGGLASAGASVSSRDRFIREHDEDDMTDTPAYHTDTHLTRTPSASSAIPSSAASPRSTADHNLTLPVTPNAIGTLASAHFPSCPRGGGTGASAFTATSTANCTLSVGSPTAHAHNSGSSTSLTFHLESREDMLRRRQAAPSAFYASASHPTVTSSPASYNGGGVYSPGSLRPHHAGNTPMSVPVSPLVSIGNTPVMAPQCPYDYILVLDFEATCEEYPPSGYLYEIIEFPVVLVDVHTQRTVTEFHRFVKPRYKPILSTFCKNLTGITQEDIDSATPLEEVIRQFERWLHLTVPPTARVVFATDGPMDFREFMLNHSVHRQGIRFPTLFYQFIDVKQVFAAFLRCQPGKIKAMLEVLNVPFEGRLHSGLDDARNIARIVIGLLQWGATLCEAPLNRLPLSSSQSIGSSSSAAGVLYLPPSAADAPLNSARSPQQQQQQQQQRQTPQRGALAFNNSGTWVTSARDMPYSVDGSFYA